MTQIPAVERDSRPPMWENRGAPEGAGNTASGADPASLDNTEEHRLMPTLEPPTEGVNTPPRDSIILEDGTPFWVTPIDKATARDLIVTNHYSRTWNTAFGTYSFGVFDSVGLAGALVFGNLMNTGSATTLADVPPESITELNRMWIHDRLGPNTETAALARAMRHLKTHNGIQLVQTFADGRLGCGTVYKAANFGYYGAARTQFFAVRGTDDEVMHGTQFTITADSRRPGCVPTGMLKRNLRLVRGELDAFTVKTYRYLYPLTKYARRRILLNPEPYPAYDKGTDPQPDYVPPASQIARCQVIAALSGYDDMATEFDAYLRANYSDTERQTALDRARQNEWVTEIARVADEQPALFGGAA